MDYEKKLLTALVEGYRKSRKDSGAQKINRRTLVKPQNLYKKYNANDGDLDEIAALNETVSRLEKEGFLTPSIETFGTQIQCIYLRDEKILDIERYLGEQYGHQSKDSKLEALQQLVERYQDASPCCTWKCASLAECLEKRAIPKDFDELPDVLKAVAFIENNQDDLFIREASMKIYGDSKFFENQTLLPVCKLLREYSKKPCAQDELPDEILLDFHIAKEPQKLCIKGKAILTMWGNPIYTGGFSEGVEFFVSDLENIQSIQLLAPRFVTIENRTSYLRYQAEDAVTFFLGGFASRYQRDFIKLIHTANPEVQYQHFGDIDAGGFWIHHNLCAITGVAFSLFGMSVEELKNPAFKDCLHKLTANDILRLNELKKLPEYGEVISYMLEHEGKLEQEIVSLQLMKK